MRAWEAVVAVGSLLEELARRQAESRRRIEELGRELAGVRARLEAEEERLSRLVITMETVEEIAGEAVGALVEEAEEPEVVRRGVVTVPPWRPGLEAGVLPQAYRDVLEVLADAGGPMRAGRISAALGRGESAAKVEGLRGKLKRLVERGWLAEGGPGEFTLAPRVRGQIAEGRVAGGQ